jgi:VIT1/CCC1 family predicted Fe2+/Mn2+ transporter
MNFYESFMNVVNLATSFWSYSSAMLIFVVVFAFVSKPFRSVVTIFVCLFFLFLLHLTTGNFRLTDIAIQFKDRIFLKKKIYIIFFNKEIYTIVS